MEINEVILNEIKEMRGDISQIRTVDMPALRTDLEVFKGKIALGAKITAYVGSGVSVVAASIVSWVMHHALRSGR